MQAFTANGWPLSLLGQIPVQVVLNDYAAPLGTAELESPSRLAVA
jgi:hypothetical protein